MDLPVRGGRSGSGGEASCTAMCRARAAMGRLMRRAARSAAPPARATLASPARAMPVSTRRKRPPTSRAAASPSSMFTRSMVSRACVRAVKGLAEIRATAAASGWRPSAMASSIARLSAT